MANIKLSDLTNLNPAKIRPHGDRYIVEKLSIDNIHVVPETGKVIKIEGSVEEIEERDGYFVARIIAGGDGYRMESDVYVKMPYFPGDVVMVERFSGRKIRGIGGRTFTIVNQVDILAALPELVVSVESINFENRSTIDVEAQGEIRGLDTAHVTWPASR